MPGRYRKPQADAGWAAQMAFLRDVSRVVGRPIRFRWRFESESGVTTISARMFRYE